VPLILSRDAHGSKIYTPAMLMIAGFLLGVASGMRSMTPMAVVAWAAQLRWPQLQQTGLSFLTAPVTAYIFTACAAIELVFDKLPFTPSRLGAGPLGARILFGGLAAAALCAAGHQSIAIGAVVGAIGGIAGAFAGYHVRHYLTTTLKAPALLIALAEDALAIGISLFAVTRL
jgi:uncharacterized membrane protein